MSNFKSIFLLLTAVAALVAANVLVRLDGSRVTVSRRTALLESEGTVARIVLSRAGSRQTVLTRVRDRWMLVEPYAGSADERVVKKLIDTVSAPCVQDVISDSELLRLGRTRADFSLEKPFLALTFASNGREDVISFGSPTPSADGLYATVSGAEGVFVVPSRVLDGVDVPAQGFRLRSLVLPSAGTVDGFDIKTKPHASLEFVRGIRGWTVSGECASAQKVDKFLAEISSAEAGRFVWPVGASNETKRATTALLAGFGLDPDVASTISLKRDDGTVDQITFGKEAEEGLVYALIQNGSAIATVSSALKDAVEQAATRFTDSRLFPVEARSVSLLSITSGNVLYALSRDKDGVWRFASPIAAPAEQEAVEEVLSRVVALTSADVVPYGGIQVSVMTNAVRASVPRESVLGKLTFEDLRSKDLLKIDPALVSRIVRQTGASGAKPDSVVYVRDRRVWNIETSDRGERVDQKGVETVLSAVNPLTAVRVEKLKVPAADLDAYGLGKPFLTIAIDQNREDAVRRNILVGGKTKGGRFATIGSSEAVFVLSSAQIERLSAPIVGK